MAKVPSGILGPEDQLRVLGRIWGLDRSGYVFVPYINGEAKDKDERRANYHEGRAYKWPREKAAILAHLRDHQADDLYFSANIFNAKRRIEQNVASERILYADLDPVDPSTLGHLKPTIAWESSPGHYQGVWLLDSEQDGASWAGKENHRLTTLVGADPSGWDSTQLLRVPGRPNYKPEYKTRNGGEPVSGAGLLWLNGPRYTWGDFDDLPEVGAVLKDSVEVDQADEAMLDAVDRHEVWQRVRLKVSKEVREYLSLKIDPGPGNRNEVLWQIERDLADAGCSVIEIMAIVRASVWNKYKGRNDELKRLKVEASKAIAAKQDVLEPDVQEDDTPKPDIQWLSSVVQQKIPRPRWLIRDIWTRGGLGFISGAPKSYKSWMALDMAVSIATGGYFLNHPSYKVNTPQPVLYLQEEDDLRLVMDRLSKITEAKAPDHFWHGQMYVVSDDTGDGSKTSVEVMWAPPVADIPIAMHVQTGFIASDPSWQAWLADIIEEGQFAMVIIDTLGTVAGDIDTDKSGELMTRMLKPLRVVARRTDTAICMVHHNKKAANQGQRAGQDMLGSTALHAWVECAIYARSKEANGEILVEREAKFAMDMSIRIKIPHMFENTEAGVRQLWEPEIIFPGVELEAASPTPADTPKAGTAGKQIAYKIKAMGKGPFTVDELMERLGEDSPRAILKQLEGGVKNGYLTDGERDGEAVWATA